MNFVTSVFKKYIKNEGTSKDNEQLKQDPGESPASKTACQSPESLNKSDEEDFQDAEANSATSNSSGDPQQAISSNTTITNQEPPVISQQEDRFSPTSAITEPDSLDTSIIDSLDGHEQTDDNFDESNLIDSIEIPQLIDGISEYEQIVQDHKNSSQKLINSECNDSNNHQQKQISDKHELQVHSEAAISILEEASHEGALEQLIRSVNETLVLNDSPLDTVLKDKQTELQSKELSAKTANIGSELQNDESCEKSDPNKSSENPNLTNKILERSCNPTLEPRPQETSIQKSRTDEIEHNLDQSSKINSSPEIPKQEIYLNSETATIGPESQTIASLEQSALNNTSRSPRISNDIPDTSRKPTDSKPEELSIQPSMSDEILGVSPTNQHNQSSVINSSTEIFPPSKSSTKIHEHKQNTSNQSCLIPNQSQQWQPITAQEKTSTIDSLAETKDAINDSPLDKNVDGKTEQELVVDTTYERQETKEFEKLEELANNSLSKVEIDDILDYLVEKSTSPKQESKQELQVEPDQKSNESVLESSSETKPATKLPPNLLLQEIASLPLPDDESPSETDRTFFRQDTREFEAIEKQCLLEVQNENNLNEVPEENSIKVDEKLSKPLVKNSEETVSDQDGENLSQSIKSAGPKNEVEQSSEAVLLDLMSEKFNVQGNAAENSPPLTFQSETPAQEEGKKLCRQDTHEFEIMEKQCMLEAQKEQISDKLANVSEILEEDVNRKEDNVNDSSSSSADTVIAVNESAKTDIKEVIKNNEEQLENNFLNEKPLVDVTKQIESSTKDACPSKKTKEEMNKESAIIQEDKHYKKENGEGCANTSLNNSAEISARNTRQDDEENKVSETPQYFEEKSAIVSTPTLTNDNHTASGIPKNRIPKDEVTLKKYQNLLDVEKPGSPNKSDDEQIAINDDKESLISSDNRVSNDTLDVTSTNSENVRLEKDANLDSKKRPDKPQFNKQHRKTETRNKAEVRPTIRISKQISNRKTGPENDSLCKDDQKTGHENSPTKVTNTPQCSEAFVAKMKKMLTEYENQIAMQAAELERLRCEAEMNVRHFTNTEMAFSDVFEKYEKSKAVIAVYRRNEDVLLENIERAEEQLVQLESKCQAMKQQSMTEIRRAEHQVNQEKEKYKRDISKMQGQIKRLEIKASSLELALKQKNDECQALAALCDDITGRSAN